MSATEERRELWGGETTKAVANFPVSGETVGKARDGLRTRAD